MRFGDFYLHPDYPERTNRFFAGEEYRRFTREPAVIALDWPEAVVRDWLWEHGDHQPFFTHYGHIDLSQVGWTLELLPPEVFVEMPTDPDATHYLRETSSDPSRINVMPPAIQLSWSTEETWREPPIVIDRRLVDGEAGLHLIEGRGRVGMLRGRVLQGMSVAPEHRAWVGRPRPPQY